MDRQTQFNLSGSPLGIFPTITSEHLALSLRLVAIAASESHALAHLWLNSYWGLSIPRRSDRSFP